MSDADDEADALVRAAKNDREAFGRLFDRYHPLLHRYCQRRLAGKDGADDVVAEAFLAIARGMREFPGKTNQDFRCWAYRIASNAANLHLVASTSAVTEAGVFPVTMVKGQEPTQMAGRMYEDDIVTESFRYEDGALLVSSTPGLGIELDPEKVERYRVR